MSSFVRRVFGTATALTLGVVDRETEHPPPSSGEVDAPMRVVVCSSRVRLEGDGDALVARDVAELLMALDDARRTAVVVDVASCAIDLAFLARLSRDFPPSVAILVEGVPHVDRQVFHQHGIYRAQFDPRDEGTLPIDGAVIDRRELHARVATKLERQPTPLIALRQR